jgi:hypothetical protein
VLLFPVTERGVEPLLQTSAADIDEYSILPANGDVGAGVGGVVGGGVGGVVGAAVVGAVVGAAVVGAAVVGAVVGEDVVGAVVGEGVGHSLHPVILPTLSASAAWYT